MILFVIAMVLFAIAVGVFIKKTVTLDSGYRGERDVSIRWVGAIFLGVGLVLLALDSFTVIPTRNLGVQTSFGKPVGTLKNGFHLVAPWTDIHKFDATIQTLKMTGGKDDNGDPVPVRLANAGTATVDVTVQWQIDPNADITILYQDFKDFENIGKNVVERQLADALNAAFEKYDPLVSLKTGTNTPGQTPAGKTLADLAKDVSEALTARMPAGVKIRSVLLPKINFDTEIQAKINQFLAALAETQIAEQRQKTAEAQKKANDLLAKGNSTSAVLYQNCLDMVERLTRDGKTLPAAFTCGLPPTTVVPVK